MADPIAGDSTAEPLPQIDGVTIEFIGAGTGDKTQTSGVWQHVAEFKPPVNQKNFKCLPPILGKYRQLTAVILSV